MKVNIFNNPVEAAEPVFFLKMGKVKHGVEVFLVDTEGQKLSRGIILRINNDMTLYRYEYINTNLGLPLDEMSRLVLGDNN